MKKSKKQSHCIQVVCNKDLLSEPRAHLDLRIEQRDLCVLAMDLRLGPVDLTQAEVDPGYPAKTRH